MLPDLQPREQLATCTHCGATCVASKHYKHPATGARLCGSWCVQLGLAPQQHALEHTHAVRCRWSKSVRTHPFQSAGI